MGQNADVRTKCGYLLDNNNNNNNDNDNNNNNNIIDTLMQKRCDQDTFEWWEEEEFNPGISVFKGIKYDLTEDETRHHVKVK